jgi:hypothetical protein
MRRPAIIFLLVFFAFVCFSMIHAQADTRAVNSRFERCGLTMERVDRAIRRYEDIIEKQKRS